MNLRPKFWNADKIVSISAILISLGTMGVYIYQTHLIQKQQYASVMPYLRMGYSFDESRFEFIIFNEGLGPASIEEVNTYFDGKKYRYDVSTFIRGEYLKKDTLYPITSSIEESMFFSAGKKITLLSVNNSIEKTQKLSNLFFTEKLEMEVIYSSIYGDKWIARGVGTRPKKLEN